MPESGPGEEEPPGDHSGGRPDGQATGEEGPPGDHSGGRPDGQAPGEEEPPGDHAGGRPGGPTSVAGGTSVFLRRPGPGDEAEFLAMATSGGAARERWIRAPRSPEEFAAYLVHAGKPTGGALLACTVGDGAIAGVFNLSSVAARRRAFVSYFAHPEFAGRGLMTEGLTLVTAHAFGPMGLRLLAASIDEDNAASVRFVERAGFRREKDPPRYLQLLGIFRSHPTWTLTADRWRERG